jgi:hypothetical protein
MVVEGAVSVVADALRRTVEAEVVAAGLPAEDSVEVEATPPHPAPAAEVAARITAAAATTDIADL